MRVLLVEKDQQTRQMLSSYLLEWGYDCVEAKDGLEAWGIYSRDQGKTIDIVLSGWVLPGMDGPGLCEKIRGFEHGQYTYIILCTHKRDTRDVVEGLGAGADEYIIKPFEKVVLKVRLEAGRRLLRLERSLSATNNRLKRGLEQAASTLISMLPTEQQIGDNLEIDWLFRPSAFVGGDLFNIFALDDKRVSFYSIDVSGHGVPSALYAMVIGNSLVPARPISTVNHSSNGKQYAWNASPTRVASTLNKRYPMEITSEFYFTLFYGVLDLAESTMRWVRAGHPPPIFINNGSSTLLEQGDPPIGMFPDWEFTEHKTEFHKGDRLFLYSDGITEASNSDSQMFGAQRLASLLSNSSKQPLGDVIQNADRAILTHHGDNQFNDDLSMLAIEMK